MAEFILQYDRAAAPSAADGRLDGPNFYSNHEPIWSALSQYLNAARGDVLELGSGTGQHVCTFAHRTPQLAWSPSDIFDSHLVSIDAWRRFAGLTNVRAPQRIDLTEPSWTWQGEGKLAAMLCINVLHISPWPASQNLIAGAGRLLRVGGKLFIYGPFKRDGAHIAPSNAAFDASLRAQNPQWGVRDVRELDALAQSTGLTPADIVPMPANNFVLAFTRGGRQE
jgi:SAM-dependent methyltransferase